jgi:hypothetical protein
LESKTVRTQLRNGIATAADRIWLEHTFNSAASQPFETSSAAETLLRMLHGLSPANDVQRSLKDQAIQTTVELSKIRLLLFTQKGGSTPGLSSWCWFFGSQSFS